VSATASESEQAEGASWRDRRQPTRCPHEWRSGVALRHCAIVSDQGYTVVQGDGIPPLTAEVRLMMPTNCDLESVAA